MFDSVLDRGVIPRRLGTGAVVSILGHAALLSVALLIRPPPPVKEAQKVIVWPTTPALFKPGPPPAGGGGTPAPRRRPSPKPNALLVPAAVPVKPPPEVEPPPDFGPAQDAPPVVGKPIGNGEGPATGGPPEGGDGRGGGTGGKCVGDACDVDGFDKDGMTAPVLLNPGRAPAYTREALEARVQGHMTVECVVTLEGRLERCRALQSLPSMERAVVEALMTRRYAPATQGGRPLAVRYRFKVQLVLPE